MKLNSKNTVTCRGHLFIKILRAIFRLKGKHRELSEQQRKNIELKKPLSEVFEASISSIQVS